MRWALDDFHRALWQRLHEGPAVRPRHDAIVENDDDATVTLCSNQTTHALAKFQDRFGQGILGERIAAAPLDEFEFRFDERMIGYGKRKARNDNIAKRLARNIHAAPKAVSAKQHAARR